MKHQFTSILLGILLLLPLHLRAESKSQVIDAVVASVNDTPITLIELCQNLRPPRRLSFKEASLDPEARFVLDNMIMEKLLSEEAASKHIQVSDGDVDTYIYEVAKRNNLTKDEFDNALKKEKKDPAQYREEIRTEILKSKLASSLLEGGMGITSQEIEEYIKSNPSLSKAGAKVKLSQIFIAQENRDPDQAHGLAQSIHARLKTGEDFADIARESSEGAEANEGGTLGVISETDLSSFIFDAIYSLQTGEISEVTTSPRGFHIFKVEDRYKEEDQEQDEKSKLAMHEEVRRILERQKLEAKMQTYFTSDLYKLHAVDKKI